MKTNKIMVTLECKWCGYRFDLANTKAPPEKCPYCDKKGGVSEPKTAQDLLDEAQV